ncbi:DUF2897 family protein [Photobacterium aphoticum]|uniref:Succinyl-diaminopimelate desuccinylase n=1 Tax=Photobacterium aphoticum TaxID=754436 RepID=A0A0J1JKI2_9GAMM|nr:DUF2897 family protein [Photobacterium aphoticum]KLV02597.1 succinyl-diaminopimelate desuccinylase [Photobacterium aphoticum]PSU55047.1 DUF2897 domain-containing protein [Photobacterium aphoticum]GHA47016.1 hypothetical protein GCM10007086_20990 [Photobacterium aphoticum]
MEWLFNPWVISIIVVAVVVSNIAALKYTAHMKFGQRDSVKGTHAKNKREQDLDDLISKQAENDRAMKRDKKP